jgi:hypothetical protein
MGYVVGTLLVIAVRIKLEDRTTTEPMLLRSVDGSPLAGLQEAKNGPKQRLR